MVCYERPGLLLSVSGMSFDADFIGAIDDQDSDLRIVLYPGVHDLLRVVCRLHVGSENGVIGQLGTDP